MEAGKQQNNVFNMRVITFHSSNSIVIGYRLIVLFILLLFFFLLVFIPVKIGIFYSIFYAALAALVALCMWVFFQTLDPRIPKWKLKESLIGTNPGGLYNSIILIIFGARVSVRENMSQTITNEY